MDINISLCLNCLKIIDTFLSSALLEHAPARGNLRRNSKISFFKEQFFSFDNFIGNLLANSL